MAAKHHCHSLANVKEQINNILMEDAERYIPKDAINDAFLLYRATQMYQNELFNIALESGVDLDTEEDPSYKNQFDEEVFDQFWERTNEFLYKLEYNDKDKNYIKVYRMLKLESIKDINYRNVGAYWSWDEKNANEYWAKHNYKAYYFLLHTIVHANNVDWVSTILQNAHPDFLSECEITINKKSPLFIYKIDQFTLWDKSKPINTQTFKPTKKAFA